MSVWLVLTRKVGEEIVIGGNIRVKISAMLADKVRIAIQAPQELSVHRKEVQDRIDAVLMDPPI
jgi:carbon storage regulator